MLYQTTPPNGNENIMNFDTDIFKDDIIRSVEIGSYEALWDQHHDIWYKKLSEIFASDNIYPSKIIKNDKLAEVYYTKVMEYVAKAGIKNFGVQIKGTPGYPSTLKDAQHPLKLLYYAGDWGLAFAIGISVIGTRKPTEDGIKRTIKLVKKLVGHGFTVTSGLAEGIDAVAHKTAIECGGRTVAVLGCPLNNIYPKSNHSLFEEISRHYSGPRCQYQ